jgi:hypothetical protein
MSTAYSGVESNVQVGATDVDAQGWSADVEVSTFDSTTTADGGWEDMSAATKKLSGSFDIFYNSSKKPFGTLGLTVGSTVTLTLYVNKTAGDALSGSALITKMSLKSKIKDGFTVTCSFTNKGVWTLPT